MYIVCADGCLAIIASEETRLLDPIGTPHLLHHVPMPRPWSKGRQVTTGQDPTTATQGTRPGSMPPAPCRSCIFSISSGTSARI